MQFMEITSDNFAEAIQIRPKREQFQFTPRETVLYSLGRAYVTSGQRDRQIPFMIEHEGKLVGSIRLRNYGCGVGFMAFFIDREHQGKGLGRKALLHLIEFVKEAFPKAKEIETCVLPNNVVARNLFESIGLAYTGVFSDDCMDMEMKI